MINETMLSEVELFSELTPDEIKKVIKYFRQVKLPKGTVLFKTRDFGDELYIITSGKIRISREVGGDVELVFTILGPGTFFGEIAVIDELYRSATATAEEDSELGSISRSDLDELAAKEPRTAYKLVYSIAKVLSHRIRRSNEAMETYIRINRALVENQGFRDLYRGMFG